MAASIKSIADDLKLSKATVSWILSGQGEEKGFNENTIKRVKDYAEKIGYSPNLIAKSLSKGYTKIIGLIIPYISDQFYSHMAQAVELSLSKKGYLLILGSSEGNETKERQLIKTFRAMRAGGLIVAPTNRSSEILSTMQDENYPFVLIDRFDPSVKSSYVIANNEESSYEIIKELYQQGCRHIAIITTDTHLYVMGKRLAGYKRAVEEFSEDKTCHCLEIERDNYEQDLKEKLQIFIEEHQEVDGFFFATHYLAEEALRYFFKNNIKYRERFKFACIDSTKTLDILVPNMTRAMMPIEEMGEQAVDIVIQKIKHPEDRNQTELIMENRILPYGIE